jgi:bifunctional DNA-binding transcriptional regulator/antitoxin component of YhaV-PrlF toxin-antitoxin module
MATAFSKLSADGRTSVPASVRKKLSLEHGSVLRWEEEGDRIVVRRSGRYTSADIREALFGSEKPKRRSLEELKKGIGVYMRKRYGR